MPNKKSTVESTGIRETAQGRRLEKILTFNWKSGMPRIVV